MAFTITMLSWSVIEFGGMMKTEIQHAREAIRWATDYLLKATVDANVADVMTKEGTTDDRAPPSDWSSSPAI
ncbi:Endoglucanase 17 [Platanthera guangdongensis]|uniref:cellulase n=1 Tax=Platanthera guangdongensis TaxID=2320717 RepID=A0ABR2M490_9ASPA